MTSTLKSKSGMNTSNSSIIKEVYNSQFPYCLLHQQKIVAGFMDMDGLRTYISNSFDISEIGNFEIWIRDKDNRTESRYKLSQKII